MDKNQTLGLVLISIMLFVYIFLVESNPVIPDPKPKSTIDSLQKTKPEPIVTKVENELPDSVLAEKIGVFAYGLKGEAKDVVLENADIKLTISTFGGAIKEVLLKKHLTYEKKPLILMDEKSTQMALEVQTKEGKQNLKGLYYQVAEQSDKSLTLRIQNGNQIVEQKYSLKPEGYLLDYQVNTQGLENLIQKDSAVFSWAEKVKRVEKSMDISKISTTVNYYLPDGTFDYLSETSTDPEEANIPHVRWVSFKQKFFSAAVLSKKTLNNIKVASFRDDADLVTVKNLYTSISIPLNDLKTNQIQFYFGSNDYHILETVAEGFDKNLYFGWVVFAPINKYFFMPIFKFLENNGVGYGLIILALVFIVKMILVPLTYKSYMSMAKTRVLKPEIDEIKERNKDDQVKAQQEQMKLFSQVGVNPLSGCIPAVLQMPVWLAMYNFFPNIIELRQKSFLWADDLSSYDSILELSFSIPFYGDHVSLFTLLYTILTIIFTYYNQQMTTSGGSMMEQQMKFMMYFMPVMMLFFFNSFASGLTYYYCVSTIITIAQQAVIRNMVDESKVKAMLDKTREKNKGKKSFQERLEQAMKSQQAKKDDKGKKK